MTLRNMYLTELEGWAGDRDFFLVDENTGRGHLFYVLLRDSQIQFDFIKRLKEKAI